MEKAKGLKEDHGKTKGNKENPTPKAKLHVPKDDLYNTLHAHFQSSKGQSKPSDQDKQKDKNIRKHVVTLLQVKKVKQPKVSNKRIFSSFGTSKCKLLCLTSHEALDGSMQAHQTVVQLHHVNFHSNFTIDCRQTWTLDTLELVEKCFDDTTKHVNGAFRLYFTNSDIEPIQWIADDDESVASMMEFLWTILALCIDAHKSLPKTNFPLEELNELSKSLNWAKKVGVDVDLIEVQRNKVASNVVVPSKLTRQRTASDDPTVLSSPSTWKSAEYEDAMSLFGTIQWSDCTAEAVQMQLEQRLKLLDEENIEFLLELQSKNQDKKTIDTIIASVNAVLQQVQRAEKWTEDADSTLATTAANMAQFETLNNHMEIHFKNSVALQETLDKMISAIDIPRETMGILLKPISIFCLENVPEDASPSESSLTKIVEAIRSLDSAIKSVDSYPAQEMSAFQARREELITLGETFSGRFAVAFDTYMSALVKSSTYKGDQGSQTRRRSLSGGHETMSPKKGMFSRDREVSDVKDDRARRPSATVVDDVDYSIKMENIHTQISKYQEACLNISTLSPKTIIALRESYAKHVAPVYSGHLQSFFRGLKDKMPKPKAHGVGKATQWNLSFSHNPSESVITVSASVLLQQALAHIVSLCLKEQSFVRKVFFEQSKKLKPEPVELTLLMEKLFDKLVKRLVDYGDVGVSANIFEAISMIVTTQQHLHTLESPSEFILNSLLSFQLHLKRIVACEHSSRYKTSRNFSPRSKNDVSRLDEAAAGLATDDADSPLTVIYDRLVLGLFDWLEKAAATKPKYSHLVRMENYHCIQGKLHSLCENNSSLKTFAERSHVEYKKNLKAYVTWLWECEVEKLAEIFANIDSLLETVPIEEIQFHISKQDLRKAAESTNHGLEKSMKHISDRLKKHLSHSADMTNAVVQCLKDTALETHEKYIELGRKCFDMEIEPSKERIMALLEKLH
ncbi:hypothetical protein Ae201684_005429 [Aphanomyces euteiches]|uniref:Exocyst complex component Sec3 PIP2-binding N-terminal domain-containing protein n=1 Tax=Aphanomyces euteiches TaxID=100861 RepID=A0A6G0XF35_9STRA|nr:hypothetical protein Ae201684_005429 [Aphanomyces euteiches]